MDRHVLVIDDDEATFNLLFQAVADFPIRLCAKRDHIAGMALLRTQSLDALMLGLNGSSFNGLEVLQQARSISPNLPLIALTAQPTFDATVRAVRLGATDFLAKPLVRDEVISALQRTAASCTSRPADHAYREATRSFHLATQSPAPVLVGSALNALHDHSLQLAEADSPILASGELGVGKRTLLKWIHSLSRRGPRQFIKVSCDAIHESLFAEMIFGASHEQSGHAMKDGYLEQAGAGTIVLHNITALPSSAQCLLVEALELGTYRPVGSEERLPARSRFMATIVGQADGGCDISSLHPGLQAVLKSNQLRIPALRERVEHIRPLIHALSLDTGRDSSLRSRWGSLMFSESALQLLESHYWPGNVEELRNFIRRLYVFLDHPSVDERDVVEHLVPGPRRIDNRSISVSLNGDFKMINRAIVTEAIQRARGNKSAAARSLGLHRKTLYRIIESDMKNGDRKNRN